MAPEPMPLADHLDPLERPGTTCFSQHVFDEPVTHADRTIIPMATISLAAGFGFGSSAGGEPGGGRERRAAHPVGAIELNADGVHIHTTADVPRLVTIALLVIAWNIFWVMRARRKEPPPA